MVLGRGSRLRYRADHCTVAAGRIQNMRLLKEIYEYREMIFSLVRRDLRGRYKGSMLGFLWTFLNPLLQLAVYTMVFSIIMRSNIQQYYLFLFVALVPWIFFSTSLNGGCTCIMSNAEMVKKIYFPREVMPISFVSSCFINMLLSFVAVFGVLLVTGYGFNPLALLFMPLIMAIEYLLALGMVLLASALTVYFRDLAYILSILTMAWQFLTPVMYASSMLPEKLQAIWRLNPMTPVVEAYRAILYYKQVPDIGTLGAAFVLGLIFLVVGELMFRRLQRGFAEEM